MVLTQEQTKFWHDNGYLLLKKFYSRREINSINKVVDDLWSKRSSLDSSYVIDIFVETEQEKRVFFRDAPIEARDKPYKLNDLFLSSEEIRQMAAGQRIAPILRELLEGDLPMICNSLTFEFGSQQDYHFDTFYMPSPTPNKMIASWVALEKAHKKNGPLTYYPRSHKIPPYLFSNGTTLRIPEEMPAFFAYMGEQIEQRGLQPQLLLAKKGDVLIWHSQLYHGGSPILNARKTRKSLVTHYFTKEDFPEENASMITDNSCFMARTPQPVPYAFD
jgi:ectoine hydroxylase-related dioxygenase (phytanoyl-CoA dioxygenase family)